ncbi:MAG TPA: DUF2203 domain-containing protein [Pyrinomonadaceae bacterium]|nr:DUF2203 domain-containing protein [Pyrinomonadaceae bacterium]
MKIFTVEEANALLPTIIPKLRALKNHYACVNSMREEARAAASASEAGGGMEGGSNYVQNLYEIGKITTEINDFGVQLKDYERGLIDFPSIKEGRVVLLCWQLGENDQIEWWHEQDGGFAGRKPL